MPRRRRTTIPSWRSRPPKGRITVELWPEDAPGTVANFLHYVDTGFYDDTIFHRVIEGVLIQGGGLTPELNRKIAGPPIRIESKNGLLNVRGTIAMARGDDKDSATSEFYINLQDNPEFDASVEAIRLHRLRSGHRRHAGRRPHRQGPDQPPGQARGNTDSAGLCRNHSTIRAGTGALSSLRPYVATTLRANPLLAERSSYLPFSTHRRTIPRAVPRHAPKWPPDSQPPRETGSCAS